MEQKSPAIQTLSDSSILTPQRLPIGRLTFYFGLVYFLQGVCQYTALINQPVIAYLRDTLGFDGAQTTAFRFWLGVPWTIKPIYGLLSDFIPLLGYRRRSYLLLSNLAAAVGFMWMSGISDAKALMIAGIAVGVSVAAADVIVDALMVEYGKASGKVTRFQGVQWACLYTAALLSGVLSSYLLEWYTPLLALQRAALVCAIMPAVVFCITWWSVPEKKARLDTAGLAESGLGLLAALKSVHLWIVLVLIALLAFNPGMWTPANYYFTQVKGLSDSEYAFADIFFSGGAILAAVAFIVLPTKRLSTRVLQTVGILLAAASMTPYFFIETKGQLYIGNIVWGFGYQVGSLATLSLAAQVCPKRAEGFVFAALLSVSNLSTNFGEYFGGQWYEGFAAHRLWILLAISTGITLAGLPIVMILPRKLKAAGEEEEGREVEVRGST